MDVVHQGLHPRGEPHRVPLQPSLCRPVLAGPAVVQHEEGVARLQPALHHHHVRHLSEQSLTDAVLRVLRALRVAPEPGEVRDERGLR